MDSALAYEKFSQKFLKARDKSSIGSKTVGKWVNKLPKGSEVIEIACGGGYPITTELVNSDIKLWAMDSSEALLSKFQERFPNVPTQCQRVQESDFFQRKFDAAISIGLMFLLDEQEQINFVQNVSDILKSQGKFLFTAPLETGKWKDITTGITCTSLGYESYKQILEKSGFKILSTYDDVGKNNYYETMKLK